MHDNTPTAQLYELTKHLPRIVLRLAELPEAELPEGFGPANEAFGDAVMRMLMLTARARVPAQERAAAMGRRLAELEDAPASTQERRDIERERMRLTVYPDLRKAFDEGYRIAQAEPAADDPHGTNGDWRLDFAEPGSPAYEARKGGNGCRSNCKR